MKVSQQPRTVVRPREDLPATAAQPSTTQATGTAQPKTLQAAVYDGEFKKDPNAGFGANHAAAFMANLDALLLPGSGATTATTGDPARQAADVALQGARTMLGKAKDVLDVAVHGALALPHALATAPSAARSWWQSTGKDHVTGPAGPAPTGDPTRIAPSAVKDARAALKAGNVEAAWAALATGGDGFARLTQAALGEKPPRTLYAQVMDAHWERVSGQGVTGENYAKASKALLGSYLDFVEQKGALPSTEDIERMDRKVMEKLGLPVLLATGSFQSRLAQDHGANYSWGRAMGLPRERTVGDSKVFSDVKFDATAEMVMTAHHATMKYGLTKALTLDGAAATLRGTNVEGNALYMSKPVLLEAKALAAQGRVADAWAVLARHGDGYAAGAQMIIAQKDNPQHFLAQTVDAHWDRVVGPEKKAQVFMQVGQRHLDNYLALTLGPNNGKLPNTEQIERSYRDAVEAFGCPPMLAIDSLMSRADTLLESTWLSKLGIKDFSWAAVVGVPKERVVYNSKVFMDLPFNPAEEIAKTAWATVRKHAWNVVGWSAVSSGFNAAREIITQGR